MDNQFENTGALIDGFIGRGVYLLAGSPKIGKSWLVLWLAHTVYLEYNSSKTFDWDNLKNHRNYYYGITHLENDFAISIYDKDTLWEVARIK